MLSRSAKPLRWIVGTLTTPPLGHEARLEAGTLLRRLQQGELIPMPWSRPMPRIGGAVHELRVADRESRRTWRIVYRIDHDEIVVIHRFAKSTQATPNRVIDLCKKRLERYQRG